MASSPLSPVSGVIAKVRLQRNILSWPSLLLVAGIGSLLWLAFFNLGSSPAIWFDEGEALRGPKTLVQFGKYGVWSAGGFLYFGTNISVGPPVLLPIALVFKLFGIGLVQARLVIVTYLLLATGLFWLCSYKVWQSKYLAGFALLLLCATPGIDFITLGRQGLGEIPALFYFLVGTLAWFRANRADRPDWKWLLGAGSGWALAAISKNNYGLILPAVLIALWLLYRFYYRRKNWGWQAFLFPLLMVAGGMGAWYGFVLIFLGNGDFSTNLNLLRATSGGSAFVFSPARSFSAIKFLFGPSNYFGLSLAGLFYGLWLARKRSSGGQVLIFPLVFSLFWLGWFVFASVGWPRYAFPALVVSQLFTARLLWDLPGLLATLLQKPAWVGAARVVTGLAVAGLIIWSGSNLVAKTLRVEDSPQQMATYLQQHVATTSLVETWESELGFLTDHPYHHPPTELLDKAVRRKWSIGQVPPLAELYQPEKFGAEYLVDGPFAKWSALYHNALSSTHYQLVISFGNYDLYRKIN